MWVVDEARESTFKILRDATSISVVGVTEGLLEPYIYSDMTGAGLNLVVNPPVG